MRKLFKVIVSFVLLSALFIMAIYFDVPNYITYYTKPDANIEITSEAKDDYSKCTGLVEYILDKNKNEWENGVPDAFYLNLGGVKNVSISICHAEEKSLKYEYNPSMGVLKLNKKCLYLKNGDKAVFNLLFETT